MNINYTKNLIVLSIFFLTVLILSGCQTGKKDTDRSAGKTDINGSISISGAFALYPLTVQWVEEYNKKHPKVQINVSAGGAGKGMTDVLSGMVDLAMFSREVSPEEAEKGAWKISVAKDAVFPTINANNPVIEEVLKTGLTREQFGQMFTGKDQKLWNEFEGYYNPVKINVYTRSDACGAAAMWAKFFDKAQEELYGTGVYGDPGLADAVRNDKYGVGYNNLIYIYDNKTKSVVEGLAIIPLDMNKNRIIDPEENIYASMGDAIAAIQQDVYPSPPARELYLVSKGKPSNAVVIGFLQYVLTEGQKLIDRAGYVQLTEKKIEQEIAKLSNE